VSSISGVTTSIFRDGAYVGELQDNFGAEFVEMTLVFVSSKLTENRRV
jgi:hypothetical protein